MGKSKRVVKGIYSLIKRIDEHIQDFYDALEKGDFNLAAYYIREIQTNFIDEIEKKITQIRVSKDLEEKILSCYDRYYEIKSISWDKS